MTWWNAGFVAVLLAVSSFLAWNDPAMRAARARRRQDRLDTRLEAKAADNARQLDQDAIYRNYRNQMRLYAAGHDPNLAGPVRLPSQHPNGSGTPH